MRICKNQLIPCPAVLTAWSELPCMWNQEQCTTWQNRIKELSFQDKNGNLFKADFKEIAKNANELFIKGFEEVTLEMIFPDK